MAVLTVALVFLVSSLLTNQSHPDTESTARELGKRVESRLALLDGYASQALESDPSAWLRLEDLPEDMVVYRYREDTLQSWAHQFPLRNDDIRARTFVQRLGDGRGNAVSPLASLSSTLTYVNYGPKWYLARSIREGETTVIVGLEVGFICAYKAGWKVNTLALVSSTILAAVLIFVGFFLYKEQLSLSKIAGVVICLVGLYFINK